MKAEPWFVDVIAEGIQQLMLLNLDRTPAGEVVKGTIMAWCMALWPGRAWDEGLDRQRVRAAFIKLMAISRMWPAPAQLIENLPARPEMLKLSKQMSDGEREANMRRLQDLVESIGIKSTRGE